MISIGIRELRQQASKYIRIVASGKTVQVTDRGRPVALLVPIPDAPGLRGLEAQGRITEADGDFLDLGDPLPPTPGIPLPSQRLADLRRDER